MPTQLWIFTNRQDGSRICFNGETKEARAFLDTLKARVLGDWCLQGEIEPTMIQAAPVRLKTPPPPPPAPETFEEKLVEAPVFQAVEEAAPAPVLEQLRTHVLPVSASVAPEAPSIAITSPPLAPLADAFSITAQAAQYLGQPAQVHSLPGAEPSSLTPPPSLLSTERVNGKRRHLRYSIPFRVILTSGVKSFRSVCHDISMGGIRIKHRVPPEMFGKTCKIFIGSPFSAESLELNCKIVADPSSADRICFVDCPPSILKQLESWILDVDQSKKSAA